jgi:hypothetical protein
MAVKLLAMQREHDTPQDVARHWVWSECDRVEDVTDDWDSVMQRVGIKDQVRLPMLKSEHQEILSTQPLSGWLVEIVDTFYEYLEDLELSIQSKLSEPDPYPRGGGEEEEPEYTIPQAPGGHLAVFKSVEGRRIKECIKEDGTVSLLRLQSRANTDFAVTGGLYFTHQIWVAKAYSRLIGDVCNVADRRTVELHVPLSHFKEIKTWELAYGDEWKQLIWHSRKGESPPRPLQRIKAQYGCIQAPIAHAHSKTITKLDSWEQMECKHVMTKEVEEDGETQTLVAMQQVWLGEGAITELEDAVVNKAYFGLPERGLRLVEEPWNDPKHLD